MLVLSQSRPLRALPRRQRLQFSLAERAAAGHGAGSAIPGSAAGGTGSAPTWQTEGARPWPQVSPAPPPQVNNGALHPTALRLARGAANRLLPRQRARPPQAHPYASAVGAWLVRAAVTRARGFHGPQLEAKRLERAGGGPRGGTSASPLPPWRSSGLVTASTAPAVAAAAMCGPAPLSWAPGTWWETGAGGSRRRWGGGDWGRAQRACAGVRPLASLGAVGAEWAAHARAGAGGAVLCRDSAAVVPAVTIVLCAAPCGGSCASFLESPGVVRSPLPSRDRCGARQTHLSPGGLSSPGWRNKVKERPFNPGLRGVLLPFPFLLLDWRCWVCYVSQYWRRRC